MMITRIDLSSDHLQCQFKRLHRVNAYRYPGQVLTRPTDFNLARPIILYALRSEDKNRNFNVALPSTQLENAFCDNHGIPQ